MICGALFNYEKKKIISGRSDYCTTLPKIFQTRIFHLKKEKKNNIHDDEILKLFNLSRFLKTQTLEVKQKLHSFEPEVENIYIEIFFFFKYDMTRINPKTKTILSLKSGSDILK